MVVQFANIDMDERPILILKRADETPIGVLGYATNVEFDPKYNELSILSFKLPAVVDGVNVPFYDEVTGQRIIELKGIGQFRVSTPKETGDKVTRHKEIEAQSLECEFARKQITLPESTYKFYDRLNPDGTCLGMIMELMPNWSVGDVGTELYNKWRTYSISTENLYNFMMGTAQEAYNCIFEFDTLNRKVNVRDADDAPAQKQVYISRDNLAKDITVSERPDDLVTRLDVNGADGVDIREVNPTGDNYLVDLEYFMTTDHFSQEIIDKYHAWKQLIEDNRGLFYNYAIQYAMRVSEELAENAKLTDLQGEYTSLENIQSVIIQGIASGIKRQADLDTANANLAAKQTEIDAKQAQIDSVAAERKETLQMMQSIRDACAYDAYFTEAERKILDAYIVDNAITESSFVASEVQTYSDGAGNNIRDKQASITGGEVAVTESPSGSTVYAVSGGTASVVGLIFGTVVSAVFEQRASGKVVLSIYLTNGTYSDASFPTGCISISGNGSITQSGTSVSCDITDGYMYFSLNASDYEKKTVAWELYEYGEAMLKKMSVPSYSFSVNSANFIALEPFLLFKNELELGQRVYIQIGEDQILKPILTGAKIRYSDKTYLELTFNDTFTANDGQAKLIDMLGQSVSTGKTLSSGKFTYEAWTNSGAASSIQEFMNSALDTAKNAIMSSTDQAVSWDGAGLRLRKWNDAHTGYDKEQIWMSNNSIVMTKDSWATAEMAIGKFSDTNLGDCWGIVAPMVVGTLLAGTELVIESAKKSGSQSGDQTMFRVDADGARLYNADFEIQKTTGNTTTQILLDPAVGVAMGTYPLLKNGAIDEDNAKFYVKPDGTMVLAGTIYSYDGVIGGWTISQDGLYSGATDATSVGLTSSGDIRIWAGKLADNKASAPFYVKQDGTLHTVKGEIGGWYIGTDYIGNMSTKAASTVGMASGATANTIVYWAGGTQAGAPFRVSVEGHVWASNLDITGGSITIKDGNTVMFNVTDQGAVTANDITINGGSITIKDGNTIKFSVTRAGKVTINDGSITIKSGATTMFSVTDQGYLTAISGKVGGWYIGSDYIGNVNTKANSTVGMAASTTSADIVFWAGGTQSGAPFRVSAGGALSASNMAITGGSITIKDASGNVAFQVTSVGAVTANNMTITGGSIKIGDNFQVLNTGAMTAKSGSIAGWAISTYRLSSGSGDGGVGLDSNNTKTDGTNWDQPFAIWCGNTTPGSAPFRVRRDGILYINKLMIKDSSGAYSAINLSD